MKNEFAFVLVYVAAFGLSDILVDHLRLSKTSRILYYLLLMAIALYYIFSHSTINLS